MATTFDDGTIAVQEVWKHVFRCKAFLHWFTGEGMCLVQHELSGVRVPELRSGESGVNWDMGCVVWVGAAAAGKCAAPAARSHPKHDWH